MFKAFDTQSAQSRQPPAIGNVMDGGKPMPARCRRYGKPGAGLKSLCENTHCVSFRGAEEPALRPFALRLRTALSKAKGLNSAEGRRGIQPSVSFRGAEERRGISSVTCFQGEIPVYPGQGEIPRSARNDT